MKLLVEETENIEFISESSNGAKHFYINGIFLQSDIKNKNGRLYPQKILESEVNRYTENYIKKNRAVGELSHNVNSPLPDPNLISHKIISLESSGKNYIGKAKILDTPKGKIVKNLLEGEIQLGVSSKGLGSLIRKNDYNEVGEDFRLTTAADIVFDPSAPDAFVNSLMEDREFYFDDKGNFHEVTHNKNKKIILEAKTKSQLEKAKLLVLTNFIKSFV